MSVSYGNDSALISGTTSVTTATMPTGAAGDLLLVLAGTNHATDDTAVPTIDDPGYTLLFTYVSTGGGAQGAGAGNRRVTVWYKIRGASEVGPTVSLTGGDVIGTNVWDFTKTLSNAWSIAYTTGEDSARDVNVSITGAGGVDFQAGDLALFGAVYNASVTSLSQGITAAGATFGAITEQLDSGTTTGNDIRVTACTTPVTAGSNAAPTWTATASGATNAAGFCIRISDRVPPAPVYYRFEPPSYLAVVRTPGYPDRARWIGLFDSFSVVRVGGVLTQVKSPTSEALAAAGVEGTDWFLGGHIYTVTEVVGLELLAAGFTPTLI